jgi:hypothetical protein
MKELAEDAAQQAVARTLLSLGIDPANPLEAQKDMAALRELRLVVDDQEFQADMIHLRRWRKTMDTVQSKGMLAAIGMVCVGGLALILYGLKIKT